MCLGHDCTISKVYSDFLKAIPDRAAAGPAFLNFMKAQTESFSEPRTVTKSYPWVEQGLTLGAFASAASGYPSDHFRIDIDRNTPTNFATNKWGTKVYPVKISIYFSRHLSTATTRPLSEPCKRLLVQIA